MADDGAGNRPSGTLRGLRVLRLCSVFEPPGDGPDPAAIRFDPIGGMQTHTGELTRALGALGVVQTVVTTRPPGTPAVTRLGAHGGVVRLGLPLARFRQCYAVPAARLVPRLAARVDLIHAHLGEDLAVVPLAFAAVRRHGIPLVLTVHTSVRYTLSVTSLRSAFLKAVGGWWEQRGERRADAVITLTPRLARILVDNGVPVQRVRVIPSGVRPALFDAPDTRDPLRGLPRPRVLFLGRLHAQKSVDVLLHAAACMRHVEAHVVLVGDGPDRHRLEEIRDRLGLRDRASFLGFVGHDHVPAVLRAADVLVMPSRYEELGTALVEAMYCGVAVVATHTGGIPDLVADGVNGFLAPPGDAVGFAAAIDRLLDDPVLRHGFAEQGKRRAEAYRWDRLAPRVLDVYASLLG